MGKYEIPINKGNYSMDTPEREEQFEICRGKGWEQEYKDYRGKWISYAKDKEVSEYPLLVDIELSSICNLNCPMCYTISDDFAKKVNVKRMDYELFTKLIDEIGGKVPAIRLSLRGEATLHPKFAECIKYAKDKGIKEVSTLTHGGKLKLDYFKKIAEAGIDWITISIDGVEETYEKIRGPLKFNDLLQKIKDIKQFKDENNLSRPVIKIQGIWPAIKEDPQKYYDMFAPYVDLVAFNPLIDYLGNDLNKDNDIQYVKNFSCPQQYQRLVIGADGLVMKCSNDEENDEVIGDVNKQSVHEIWHGENMKAVREMHNQPMGFLQSAVCRKCYLPRETTEDKTRIDDRVIIIKNYVDRSQVIGE